MPDPKSNTGLNNKYKTVLESSKLRFATFFLILLMFLIWSINYIISNLWETPD